MSRENEAEIDIKKSEGRLVTAEHLLNIGKPYYCILFDNSNKDPALLQKRDSTGLKNI